MSEPRTNQLAAALLDLRAGEIMDATMCIEHEESSVSSSDSSESAEIALATLADLSVGASREADVSRLIQQDDSWHVEYQLGGQRMVDSLDTQCADDAVERQMEIDALLMVCQEEDGTPAMDLLDHVEA
jgi:hypothetical protein